MKIIPVIDLMNGLVVHARVGVRQAYAPLRSRLTDSTAAGDVAAALVREYDPASLYLADLGAIAGAPPDWRSIADVDATGPALHVDLGLRNVADVRRLRNVAPTITPIVGLESLAHPAMLASIADAADGQGVFSLDLKNGVPIVASEDWRGLSPQEIAERAIAAGFRRLIVLDLAFVGKGELGALTVCREIRTQFPQVGLWTGGGVSCQEDLTACAAAGCEAVLAATALHDGRLTAADVRRFR